MFCLGARTPSVGVLSHRASQEVIKVQEGAMGWSPDPTGLVFLEEAP